MKLLKEETTSFVFVLAYLIGSAAVTLPSALIHDSETASIVTWILFTEWALFAILSLRLFGRDNIKGDLE